MGSANPPTPTPPLAQPDIVKAQLAALQYAQTQKKIRASAGRKSMFITAGGDTSVTPAGTNTLIGQ